MKHKKHTTSVFLEQLLDNVDKKRQCSLKEFYKTDLNTDNTIETVMKWYNQIVSEIKNAPPTGSVYGLEITEDSIGNVNSIKYLYVNRKWTFPQLEFVIKIL